MLWGAIQAFLSAKIDLKTFLDVPRTILEKIKIIDFFIIFIIFRSHFRHGFRNAPLVHRYRASGFRNAKEELVVVPLVVVR